MTEPKRVLDLFCCAGGGGQMTRGYKGTPAERREAMGIDWMSNAEIAQAIPPAYSQYIAEQFIGSRENPKKGR